MLSQHPLCQAARSTQDPVVQGGWWSLCSKPSQQTAFGPEEEDDARHHFCKLEGRVCALEKVEQAPVDPSVDKEESGGSNNAQQYTSPESSGAQTVSEPVVAVMPDEIVEDSKNSQVNDGTAEGGKAVESTTKEGVAEWKWDHWVVVLQWGASELMVTFCAHSK